MSHRLVILRHAKSLWPDGMPDHDRPLAPRGVVDAKAAGEWLRDHVGTPDHVIVSTARRARGTWTLAADAVGYIGAAGYDHESQGALTIDPRIYEARASTLLEVLREIPERATLSGISRASTLLEVLREIPERVALAFLVGHMPGCADLVDLLARDRDPAAAALFAVKYPTSGIAVLDVDPGLTWSRLDQKSARLSDFAVPRG